MSTYKPVVKWAGGKSKVISQLSKYIPQAFNDYHEPFVGGGAMFFYLVPDLINRNGKVYLSDLVKDLIILYAAIKNNVEELIRKSKEHKYEKEYYYKIRSLNPFGMPDIERASRMLFLNKTCFNGLYRVNKKGQFNVSFGDYKDPVIVDEMALRSASRAFQIAEISHGDFELVLKNAQKGDFIYLDPPYVPLSATSDFTQYTPGLFNAYDHKRLKDVFDNLKEKGCYVMLSNSDTDFVVDLYSGYNIKTINASRAINSNIKKRGAVKELLILSYADSETRLHLVAQERKEVQV